MPGTKTGGGSRTLLKALRRVLAEPGDGQARLDKVVRLVAGQLVAEVCSIYLKRDRSRLELCATEGLHPDAVHRVSLKIGHGLVGRIAQRAEPIATSNAQEAPGFQYIPETREEAYRSFAGVPIQRLGEVLGVLVIQNRVAREYTEDEIDGLEIVAMVIAEMTEAGMFTNGEEFQPIPQVRTQPVEMVGIAASEGLAEGPAHLHEPRVMVFNPIAENVESERARLHEAMTALRGDIDDLVRSDEIAATGEHRDVLEAYRMFAYDKGWLRRLEEAIESGLSAEVAVEKVQSAARSRMERIADPYLRERLHDLDDLANRLLRHLLGAAGGAPEIQAGAILIARNIGPGELMDHAGQIAGIVLEEGSLSSHAAIVARALSIPMVVQCQRVTRETNPGDKVVVDGAIGAVSLRPGGDVLDAFHQKVVVARQAAEIYKGLRDKPALTLDGTMIALHMNAGILSDLPSLEGSGAGGVGLYRTELQFMLRASLPGRTEQARTYARVLDAANGRPVIFRTLDIGSDKLLSYMKRVEEPNPALGWRAIRLGLDRPLLFKMQLQALIRGAGTRPLSLMFPMVTEADEFRRARALLDEALEGMKARGREVPSTVRVGAMLETPALAYASDAFFAQTDFISVGGNDLMQFFFAADRENERVRQRYDVLNLSFLRLLRDIAIRCDRLDVPLSFCGEAAGRPLEAVALAAVGYRSLSMRAASIGPVKRLLREVDLNEVRDLLAGAEADDQTSLRPRLLDWSRERGLHSDRYTR